jgi:hypothetical protein
MLQQPKSQVCHPNPGVLNLTAWLLSTDSLEKKFFFSKSVRKLLTASWRTGTQKDYSSKFRQFMIWCREKNIY